MSNNSNREYREGYEKAILDAVAMLESESKKERELIDKTTTIMEHAHRYTSVVLLDARDRLRKLLIY